MDETKYLNEKHIKSPKERLQQVKTTRWIRFGVVSLIFFLWVAWLGSWWVLLFYPLLFDIYITGYIPLTWWKNSKSAVTRTIMSWVDAIVYALVLVYFVFTFIGQNYQIPSSSLEKTLLVGDYLWVNKMSYGPRVPMTPIHFPLVQNTIPVINTKSYIEWPQWKYHRLKGLGDVQAGDIVVFNFPAGDTVTTKVQNPDYYTLIAAYGRKAVHRNKADFGDVIYRPVDRRENYVKRAVGLPGQRLKIVDGEIYIDGEKQKMPIDAQFNYFFQTRNRLSESDWENMGIAKDDRFEYPVHPEELATLAFHGFTVNPDGSTPPIYLSPMTASMVETLKANPNVLNVLKMPAPERDFLFPNAPFAADWTRNDYGEIWIPKKGATIELNDSTWSLYNRCIRNYEYHPEAYIDGSGQVFIDGKPTKTYTFQMDYYFMMGDNRDNSLDSRYWGFVPEDHIVGKPMRVLISFDKDKGILNGGIRWNRILKDANTGF